MSLVNWEAEADLLGGMLVNNHCIEDVADLVAFDDFALDLHARMFETILSESAKGRAVNPVTLKSHFTDDGALEAMGGIPYLARLTSNPASVIYSVALDTARLLSELAIRRRMQVGLKTAADACDDLASTTTEIIAHADQAISLERGDGIHQPTGGEAFDELLLSYESKAYGVQCQNIAEVDSLLGPIRPKQLIIGAGRPGMGKTAFALSYALGAAEAGHGVLFVSLEMSSTELAARMAADLCFNGNQGVYYSNIRDGDLNAWQALEVRKAQTKAHQLPFSIVDAGSLTIGKLGRLIRRHARKMTANGYKLELVVIDYLQLLSPDIKGRSTYEAVSEVSRGMKALAKDNGLGILALAQLSRSVENRPDKRPQLSDLRDSGQIEQDADAVMFLLRTEYYLKQEEPDPSDAKYAAWSDKMQSAKGLIEFIVAKRRNGETGNAFGRFHGAYQAVRGEQ
jgi:replicative DNA helicase